MFDYDYSNGAIKRTNRIIEQSKSIAFGFLDLQRAIQLLQYRINRPGGGFFPQIDKEPYEK